MSASQIPNLSTLRRGGLRSRGRGQSAQSDPDIQVRRKTQDEIIQGTDTDAATSRLSAVDAGYLDDPFARLLCNSTSVSRRLPLMNRGTYVRTTGIDRIVDKFLTSSSPTQKKQIISLGAGSDTRFFRLKQHNKRLNCVYHELDFATNNKSKIARLRSSPFAKLTKQLCDIDLTASEFVVSEDGSRLESPQYHIHPQDLRDLNPEHTCLQNVDPHIPTLIISECCLIYLHPEKADAVLQFFRSLFGSTTPLAIVIYEPIRPHDSFGRTMVSNLIARGIQLQTLQKYADLQEQRSRLQTHGFSDLDSTHAADIHFIWRHWIEEGEKERIDKLEWMDEVEEFVLLAQHYCIAWAWCGFDNRSSWQELPAPPVNHP